MLLTLKKIIGKPAGRGFILNTLEISGEGAAEIPQRVHVLTVGKWNHLEYGEFEVTAEDIQEIVRNFETIGRWVVFDYEHQTLKDMEAPAAGWINALEIEGDNLYAIVEWTERAEQYLRNKEYRYVSPVIWFDAKDKYSGADIGTMLHSVALTNTPFLDGLQPIVNKNIQFNHLSPEVISMKELFAKLAKLLGLKEDAKPEDVVVAVEKYRKSTDEKLQGLMEFVGKVKNALQLKSDAQNDDVIQKVLTLSDPGQFVSIDDFSALQNQLKGKEVNEVIEAAKKAGKIVPANEDWAKDYALKDLDGFKKYLETAPIIVDLKDYHNNTVSKNGDKRTEEDRQVADLLGIEAEADKE